MGEIERKIQELNLQNSELTRTNQLFNEKNATVYGKYVSLEVDYDQKIKKLDLQMNKQKIEILAQQKRNEELSNEVLIQKLSLYHISKKTNVYLINLFS